MTEPSLREGLPQRIRLVVLFGGRSAEHDISCISASHVLAAIDPQRYDVVPVGIDRNGRWLPAERRDELSVPEDRDPVDPLPVLTGHADASPARAGSVDGEALPADIPTVVLPILHGPNGEDGTVQGLLEMAGLPYVGTGVLGSALAMDKAMAKTVLDALGIPQVPWRGFRRTDRPDEAAAKELLDELGPTVFVKPANMGSSIGVSRVTDDAGPARLLEAIEDALRFDDEIVLEQGVVARELECAVLGNDEPRASVIGEIVTDAEFYDYADKYFDGTARTVVPAELDPAVAEEARLLAVHTFRALRCAGMARVDLFLEAERGLLVNEVNTIPGFTPISMYPKLWQASGLPYSELIDELVALALERHARHTSLAVSPE
jgi:D-alanine-D-alanine ligase